MEDAKGNESNPVEVEVIASTVKINERVTSGYVGDKKQLTTTTTPKDQKATWTTSNSKVATVDSKTGLVTYTGVGSVRVTATLANGKTDSITINVTYEVLHVDAPVITTNPIYDITTKVTGTSTADRVVAYVFGLPVGTAEVVDGKFTMDILEQVAGQNINFVAQDNKENVSTPVNMKVVASDVKINEDVTEGYLKETQQLTATTTPAGQAVTWSSSKSSVATVNAAGLVTYKGVGSVTIKATLANGSSAQVVIQVTSKVVEKPEMTTPIYDDSTEASGTAPYPGKVIVKDPNGNVLGETEVNPDGSFTVEFPKQDPGTKLEFVAEDERGNESDPIEVNVQETTIKINETLASSFVGKTANLTAKTTPANAVVIWTSSNTNTATVNKTTGVATFKAEGSVTITATLANGKKDTITITVKSGPKVTTPIYDTTTEASGTAPTPGTVTAYVGGKPVGTATVGTDGKFTMLFPAQKADDVIEFVAKDANGNESMPTAATVATAKVKINENITAGFVQDTQTLTATTTPAGLDVAWSTSNDKVAKVDAKTGLVTYVSPGNVSITVTMKNGQTDTINITVTNEILAVNQPVLTTSPVYDVTTTIEGTAKENGQSKATMVTAYAFGLPIGTASVGTDGKFSMTIPTQMAGNMINFVAQDKRGNLSLPVNVIVVQSFVKINENPGSGFVSDTAQLTTSSTPVGLPVAWSTSDASIATVNETGLVEYKKAGTVVVKATLANGSFSQVIIQVAKKVIEAPKVTTPIYDDSTEASGTAPAPGKVIAKDKDGNILGEATVNPDGTFTVEFPKQDPGTTINFVAQDEKGNESNPISVNVIASTVTINEKVTTGKVGATQSLTATTTPAGQAVTWSTSDAAVATVNATTGLVTYKKAGSVTITVKLANGKSDTITITVTSVQIDMPTLETNPIFDVSREVVGTVAKPANKVVAYLNGYAVGTATVDSNGKFIMTIPGIMANQEISFVAEDGKGNFSTPLPVNITAATVTIDQTRAILNAYVGDTKQLTVTTNPVGQPVYWTSDDETVATVDSNGLVTFVGVGKVYITATLVNSHTATSTAIFNVTKKVLEKPVIDQPIYDTTTELEGKAPYPGKVVVKDEDGNTIGETEVNPDGSFTVTFPEQEEGKKVEFITEDDKGNTSKPEVITVQATAVMIAKDIAPAFVGNEQQLTATTTPVGQEVTWSVSNKNLATIDAKTGVITYKGVGLVKVTAKLANGKTDNVTINITNKVIGKPIIDQPIYDTTTEVEGKAPYPGKVIVKDEDGNQIGEATVDPDGSFTITFPAQKPGAVIEFTTEDAAGNTSDPVESEVKASDIKINENISKGLVGGTEQLTATTTPVGQKVTWSSSDTTKATVNATTGAVVYKAAGKVNITAKLANGTSKSVTITISDYPQPKLNPVTITDTVVEGKVDVSNYDVKQILLLVNNVNKTVASVNADGTFSAPIGNQPKGAVIEARYKDQSGNYLTAAKYVGKTTVVNVNEVDAITVNTVTTLNKVVTGQAKDKPNQSVRLFVDGQQKRTATTDANGNYNFKSGYLKEGALVEVKLYEKNVVTATATTNVIVDTEAMSLEGVTTFSRLITGKGTENVQFRLSINGVSRSVKTSDENGIYVFNIANQPVGTEIKVEMKSAGTYSVWKETTVTEGIVDPSSLTLDESESGARTVTGVTEEADTTVRLSINGATKSTQQSDPTTGDFTFNTAALKVGDVVKVDMKVNGIYAVSQEFTVKDSSGENGGENSANDFTIDAMSDIDKVVTGVTNTPNSQVRISLNGATKTIRTSDAEGKYSYSIGKVNEGDVVKVELRVNGAYSNSKEITVTKAPDLSSELTVNPVAASDKKITGSTLKPNTQIRISINGVTKINITTNATGQFTYNNSKLAVGDIVKVEMKVEGVFAVAKEVTVSAGASLDTIAINDMNATQTVMTGKASQPNARIRISLNGVTKNNITSDKDGNFTYSIGKVKLGDIIKVELQMNGVYTVSATTTVKKAPLTENDLTVNPILVTDKKVTIKTVANTQIRISLNGATKTTPTTDSNGDYTYNNAKLVAGDIIKVEVKEDGVYTISKTVVVQ
ncbi:glycoprotein [Listeria cornellensis FSL F6-0969]|uniref:Glycoprotein n=1 Tax=Listeria cornellensis FSL F6-0969 TaxID=1265820 RepID=W7BKH3_9LIST|nr:glycoprotein [Listeria cornellensis FSL F6-0969]